MIDPRLTQTTSDAADVGRGVTDRRISWSTSRAKDWADSIETGDRRRARELYEELGRVVADEVADLGGHPVLSHPAINELIRHRVSSLRGHRALDVGCGPTPVAALALAEHGFSAVAVDIAHSIVRLAADTSPRALSFSVSDGERLPFRDGTFDVITCDDVIEHVFDQGALVEELARVAAPQGRVLLVTPNASGLHVLRARAVDLLRGRRRPRSAYHITQSHVRELRWRELRALVTPRFRLASATLIEFPHDGSARWGNRFLRRLPGGHRFGAVHFVELVRHGSAPATDHRMDARSVSIRSHYANMAADDDQTSPGAVRAAFAEARQTHPLRSPVLDVGAGGGANVRDLLATGHSVVAVDISADALARVGLNGRAVAADVAHLPFREAAFASAVCTEVLEHVAEPRVVFAEARRVLQEAGRLYVTVPNYANLAGVHKVLADRRSGRHDWNPWGAHVGGYEALMTGRRLRRYASASFDVERVRALDYGQALTGRFRPLDRLALSRTGQALLRRALPHLHRPGLPVLAWHGMHTELVLTRRD